MIQAKEKIKAFLWEKIKESYPVSWNDLQLSSPPHISMGDLCFTFPFKLGRTIKKNPRQLAEEIAKKLTDFEEINKVEIAGPGYINLFLNRERFFLGQLRTLDHSQLTPEEKKIIVEHTNINPNKAAHIGHLRNACLGDTLVRCLRYKGEKVEVQNYIDDTGVQVVDVVFGFMELEKKSLEDLEKIPGKFDYYCWDLYTRVSSYLNAHPEAQPRKAEILKKIEHNEPPEADYAHYISRRILRAHLATMKRLGITYDVLPCESSILTLKFWEKAFHLLKERGGLIYVTEGPNQGCWVMRLEEDQEKEKIIVRSDGTVTYVGKDIAYQLWKFGLLERDFYYEPFEQENDHIIWITTSQPKGWSVTFGQGSKVYNVIDVRQSYLQKIVTQGLKILGYHEQANKSIHFSYEMVALSPKSLRELGYEVSNEEKDKSFYEVSGRKGLGVKADDLLDQLESKALAEVEKRNPDLPLEEKLTIARQIACGAIRYFMLRFARNSLLIFDFDEALNFEGETGPYLQYTGVRLNSIFRKLEEREGLGEAKLAQWIKSDHLPLAILSEKEKDDFWELIIYASQYEEIILESIYTLEFAHLAKFAFNLCQKINGYYHLYSILNEKNLELKKIRILTVAYVLAILKKLLGLMGIPLPEKM
ncbi:MAG: arginine--tRNA ligase [Candidatus Aminicenantes bacterium]|nr:arginine--tRNA ligase [Candidatus Aminicenantes bacterium]